MNRASVRNERSESRGDGGMNRASVRNERSESRNDGGIDSAAGAAAADSESDCAILTLVVRHGTPSVRPDDVLSALRRVADLVPPKPPRVTRLAQGPLDEAGTSVVDPFGPDRVG